jgi:hypothetical protein
MSVLKRGAIPDLDETTLINPEDFKSAEVSIELHNTTTHQQFKLQPKTKLVQFVERGMVLEVPSRCCSTGHNLIFKATVTGLGGTFKFEATVKTSVHEEMDKDVDQITIELLQYDEDDWTRLREAFTSRQSNIEAFFAAAKGYG